jgi:retinol dehydrogenase-12
MTVPMDQLTADGYDLQWGTNVVVRTRFTCVLPSLRDLIPFPQGHWLLQELLIPALARAAASAPDGRARVVHTSSDAAYIGKIDYTTVRPGASRTKKGTMGLYSQSKLGNVLVARESARRHADKGILVNAVHPGWIGTELQRHAPAMQQWISVRA